MDHRTKGRKLNKTTAHRKAMLSNMANSMLKHSRVKTTLAKAKELRRVVEKLITRAKVDSLHNKRLILKKLRHRTMLTKLFTVIAPKFIDRPGGYTRILKLGNRPHDNAEIAIIEFVEDFSEKNSGSDDKKNKAAKKSDKKVPAKKEESKEEPKAAKKTEKPARGRAKKTKAKGGDKAE